MSLIVPAAVVDRKVHGHIHHVSEAQSRVDIVSIPVIFQYYFFSEWDVEVRREAVIKPFYLFYLPFLCTHHYLQSQIVEFSAKKRIPEMCLSSM